MEARGHQHGAHSVVPERSSPPAAADADASSRGSPKKATSSHGAIVVKIGGSTLGEHDTTLEDLVTLQRQGVQTVVVHGGGKVISQWMERQGVRPRFVRGLRVTDEAGLEIVVAVLTGLINKSLVASVIKMGGRASGLSGVDGGMVRCVLEDLELGLVGKVTEVDTGPIRAVLSTGAIPVIAPVALHVVDGSPHSGSLLNLNADTVAGEVAAALEAERLVFLTDVEGVLAPSRRVMPRLTPAQARRLVGSSVATGGMVPKLEACLVALKHVAVAQIVDGRRPRALRDALDDRGVGTRIGKARGA